MSDESLEEIETAWEKQFRLLFERLKIAGTVRDVQKHVRPLKVAPALSDYAASLTESEDVSDLAD
jgi:hypothetical protein